MSQYLIAGNWKMNGVSSSIQKLMTEIKARVNEVDVVELAVFPPFVYLPMVAEVLTGSQVKWGAQTLSEHKQGAFTGEIAADMLLDFNCSFVIVGHSERRHLLGESNEQVAEKFKMALQSNLIPILCVGETLAEREAGNTLKVIDEQLAVVLQLFDNQPAFNQAVIAYEPVWAIGTGKTATPEQAEEIHAAIRSQMKATAEELSTLRILYGGSVKPNNAASLMKMPNIDGALIGGASLDANSFIEIAKQCNK